MSGKFLFNFLSISSPTIRNQNWTRKNEFDQFFQQSVLIPIFNFNEEAVACFFIYSSQKPDLLLLNHRNLLLISDPSSVAFSFRKTCLIDLNTMPITTYFSIEFLHPISAGLSKHIFEVCHCWIREIELVTNLLTWCQMQETSIFVHPQVKEKKNCWNFKVDVGEPWSCSHRNALFSVYFANMPAISLWTSEHSISDTWSIFQFGSTKTTLCWW